MVIRIIRTAILAMMLTASAGAAERRDSLYEAGLAIAEADSRAAAGIFFMLVSDSDGEPLWPLLAGIAGGMAGIFDADSARRPVNSPHLGAPASSAASAPPAPIDIADISDIGEKAFWIRLGGAGLPAVYMLADPACPHCAAALRALAPEVIEGRLQLRLALAPFVGPDSRDLAATIMLAEDPANAAWAMLLAAGGGERPIAAPGSAAAIGPIGDALLNANLDWMRSRGIGAVPHFIWMDSGTGYWKQAGGVQAAELFAGAGTPAGPAAMNTPAAVLRMLPVTDAGIDSGHQPPTDSPAAPSGSR